jgi:hypothetical protein
MPVARIYASLVEESEPLCGDLLARGYDVEVVFPDAVLTTAADLELRVERCSAEQAIARVEAAGSPSRCVFVTPAKGPRRELLLVEMTVISTGTHGCHPITLPAIAPVEDRAVSITAKPIDVTQDNAVLANVLPFTVETQGSLPADALSPNRSAAEHDAHASAHLSMKEQTPMSRRKNEGNFGKYEMVELNAFLANAPKFDRREMFPSKILKDLRHTKGFAGARNHWKGLSLLGGACSVVVLLSMSWSAASARSQVAGKVPVVPISTKTTLNLAAPRRSLAGKAGFNSVAFDIRMPSNATGQRLRSRHGLGSGDGLIAQDRSLHADGGFFNKPNPQPSAASSIQPAAIKPTTIKKITDLK